MLVQRFMEATAMVLGYAMLAIAFGTLMFGRGPRAPGDAAAP
jgi:hypothetical protein